MKNAEKQKLGEILQEKGKNYCKIGLAIAVIGMASMVFKEWVDLPISMGIVACGGISSVMGLDLRMEGKGLLKEAKSQTNNESDEKDMEK